MEKSKQQMIEWVVAAGLCGDAVNDGEWLIMRFCVNATTRTAAIEKAFDRAAELFRIGSVRIERCIPAVTIKRSKEYRLQSRRVIDTISDLQQALLILPSNAAIVPEWFDGPPGDSDPAVCVHGFRVTATELQVLVDIQYLDDFPPPNAEI